MTTCVEEIAELDASQWDAWQPVRVAELLREVNVPWAVAGGWAIDLFLGAQTREHADIEIAVSEDDFDEIAAALSGFDLFVVLGAGRGVRLDDGRHRLADTHQVWVRDPGTHRYVLDVMREPSSAGTWVFRRDRRVRMPYGRAVGRTTEGIPYLRPEIALLFKAKSAAGKDQLDFEAVLPRIDSAQRTWLAEALELVHPGHRWIAELAA